MKHFLILLSTTFLLNCTKEKQISFSDLNTEILKNSQAYTNLEESSKTIGHRLTGSENGAKAEQYAFDKLKSYGFENVQFQEFEVEAWSRKSAFVSTIINGKTKEIKTVSLGHSPLSSNIMGKVVHIGNGLSSDYEKAPNIVKGKIALIYIGILPDSPKGSNNIHRSEKAELAIKNGAIGVIIYNQVKGGILLTGTASVTGKLLPIPAICIGYEDGIEIANILKKEEIKAHIKLENKSDLIKARNVIATIQGIKFPDEKIIIGGHLDSWDLATGAIDNGIGSFAILDIARTFKANNLQPKRTVQFVLFMGEEQGLLGSTYMVNKMIETDEIEKIKLMMNLDMTGNPIGINVGGKITNQTFFDQLGISMNAIDSGYTNTFSNKASLHSDHQPFMMAGIPTLSMHSKMDKSIYDCYHSDCDDFKLVKQDDIRNTVRYGAMTFFALANAESIPAKRMNSEETRQFMEDSHLKEKLIISGDWKWEE